MKTDQHWLDMAYTVDLLSRITESIEIYLDDDRWDGIATLHAEIKEANKLVKKHYKRVNKQHELECGK
jgi:hypothetical protein